MKTSTSLTGLPQKKITTGLKRLQEAGITPEKWLNMLDAGAGSMQRLADAWPLSPPSYSYDAVAILGFGETGTKPLPKPKPGEIVIRVGDWSLLELRDSDIGKKLMLQQHWYDKCDCSSAKLTPGVYSVRLKNFTEQDPLLTEVASVALGATALLVHLKETGNDLLSNHFCHCVEVLPQNDNMSLGIYEGRVHIQCHWVGRRLGNLWLAASRKS